MRGLYLTVSIALIALTFAGCGPTFAPGMRGGIVRAESDEAVPPRSEPTFVYGGERGTVEGVSIPSYTMQTFDFADVRLALRVPRGWSAELVPIGILLVNEEADAGILIRGSEYPELEVASVYDDALEQEGVEVSPFESGVGARRVTTFAYSRDDGISGMFYGAYTRHDDLQSGVVVGGDWPSQNSDACRRDLISVFDSIVITSAPPSCERR